MHKILQMYTQKNTQNADGNVVDDDDDDGDVLSKSNC